MEQHWIDIRITTQDDTWIDAVWATNEYEAKVIAEWNWEGSEIEVL